MMFDYCPNCGHKTDRTALLTYPSVPVVECPRCGWMIREGRQPDWKYIPNDAIASETSPETLTVSDELLHSKWKEMKDEK